MRSIALAIGWEFRHRHRWGLAALLGYLILLGMGTLWMPEPREAVGFHTSGRMAAFVVVPFTSVFVYFIGIFSFGLSGNVAARQSIYPARMFTLPVSNAALAGWPMLFGTMAMFSLWLATGLLALLPLGINAPLLWPALFAAAFIAWTQALMWMPYGLPGLRVIIAVLWLTAANIIVLLAIEYKFSRPLMTALVAPQVPLAYLVAHLAISRARRGDVPDWRGIFAWLAERADVLPRWRGRFASPAHAQLWYEWRRHGTSLPGWIAILLPFELGLLFIGDVASPKLVFYTLFGVLLTPPVIAAFSTVSMTPFMARMPLTSTGLIGARLKAALLSTLAAWLLVVIAIALALTLSDSWQIVIQPVGKAIETVGSARAMVIALLISAGLLLATWKQLVQRMYIGLSGRAWAVKASVALTLSVIIVIVPVAQWIVETGDVHAALWDGLPWLLTGLASVKMLVASWIAVCHYRSRVLHDRTLLIAAACWSLAVFALYGLLVWLVATPFLPHYLLALVAILAVPLTRLSAAPLTLAWNRHQP